MRNSTSVWFAARSLILHGLFILLRTPFNFTFKTKSKIFFSWNKRRDKTEEIENIRDIRLRSNTLYELKMKRRKRSSSVPGGPIHQPFADGGSSSSRSCSSRRSNTMSSSSSSSARTSGNIPSECFDPSLVGMVVPPHTRRAGKYLLGPKLGVSPVKSIVQCLARLENTDQYFQVKLLTMYSGSGSRNGREESQDEKQGKMLLHTEYSLLSEYTFLILVWFFKKKFAKKLENLR